MLSSPAGHDQPPGGPLPPLGECGGVSVRDNLVPGCCPPRSGNTPPLTVCGPVADVAGPAGAGDRVTATTAPVARHRPGASRVSGGRAEGVGRRPSPPSLTPLRAPGRRGRKAAPGPLGTSPAVLPGHPTPHLRYQLRRHVQERIPPGEHRVAQCGRFAAPGSLVSIRKADDGTAHYSGLAVCGNLAACPVCGPKIRHGRAREIADAAREHQHQGGGLLFVTLTVPHDRGMPLADVWGLVRGAWAGVAQGRARDALRDVFGVQGYVRAVEVTHGRAGWHPHLHVLVFVDRPWSDMDQVVTFWRWVHERWARRVEALGGRRPSLTRGVQVIPCRTDNDALARYLASVGDGAAMEVAREDGKTARAPGSRTPVQLLAYHAETDDPAAWAAWREWLAESKGRRLIEWSRGLKAALLVDRDRTDEELAAEAGPAVVVVEVSRQAWRAMHHARCTVEALQVAERSGAEGLAHALRQWGLRAWIDRRSDPGGPGVLRVRPGVAAP